jgi:hypothetical protein
MTVARAKLALRTGEHIHVEVQPGFVELRYYRGPKLVQGVVIPGAQWRKFLGWAFQHQNQPTGNSDPTAHLEAEEVLIAELARARRLRRRRSRRGRNVFPS